jgi:hypothetical protein
MVKSNRRNTRRESRRNRRNRRDRRNRRNMTGGAETLLNPAAVSYSLAEDWPSKASLRQGADYFKYHTAQHGGAGYQVNSTGAPVNQITNSVLDSRLAPAAHTQGLNRAYAEIAGLKDGGDTPLIVRPIGQATASGATGGRRRKTRGRRDRRNRRDRRRTLRNRRRNGGGHGYASVNAPAMLLDARGYQMAGLNPEYVKMPSSAEGIAARARDDVL